MSHVGRKAVVIAQKSRRGIPLNWNERFQGKSWEKNTVSRRIETKRKRNCASTELRSFRPEISKPISQDIQKISEVARWWKDQEKFAKTMNKSGWWWSEPETSISSPLAMEWEEFVPSVTKHDYID